MTEELSYSEKFINTLKKAYARYKVPFLAALIVGFLTYGFNLTNKLVNHDEVYYLFGKGAELESGRWGLSLTSYIFPDYSMPWIYGIIAIVLIAVSACVIIAFLDIKDKLLQGLFAGLTIAFPSVVSAAAYMFTFAPYALAILMSVSAAYLASENSIKSKIAAIALSVLSLSIYQAYIALTSSLFLVKMLKALVFDGKKSVAVIKDGLCYLLYLALAVGIYVGITAVLLNVTNTAFGEYAESAIVSNVPFLERLKRTYRVLYDELPYGRSGICSSIYIAATYGICAIMNACILIRWAISCKKTGNILLVILIIALFPISINSMFIAAYHAVHTVMLLAYISAYALLCVVLDNINAILNTKRSRNICFDLTVCLLTVILICNVYAGNKANLHSYLAYENAKSFYTSLITRIECQSEFAENSRIAIVGGVDEYVYIFDEFNDATKIFGANGMNLNAYSREQFIKYYIGFDAEFADDETEKALAETDEFKAMPVYPYEGSIAEIDNYIVVKLGETP